MFRVSKCNFVVKLNLHIAHAVKEIFVFVAAGIASDVNIKMNDDLIPLFQVPVLCMLTHCHTVTLTRN